tara:strand:- start:196 stop:504 length:309 start_codon:yes stop_codon:yes gene_type:complete
MNEFIQFINNSNIIDTIVGTVISLKVGELTDAVVNYLIMPFINRDADGDGKADINKLEEYNIKFKGINIEFGKFLIIFIKFIIILYIIFLFNKIFKNKNNLK